jgi:hypothetical protein
MARGAIDDDPDVPALMVGMCSDRPVSEAPMDRDGFEPRQIATVALSSSDRDCRLATHRVPFQE